VKLAHVFAGLKLCVRIGGQDERLIQMTILETIVRELTSAPEPLLLKVLDFIQSTKVNSTTLVSNSSDSPRVADLHQGQIWMSDDFNEPLPDEFWIGED
jgi:hypothetical protein